MLGFFTHKAFVLNSPDHHPTLSWTAVFHDGGLADGVLGENDVAIIHLDAEEMAFVVSEVHPAAHHFADFGDFGGDLHGLADEGVGFGEELYEGGGLRQSEGLAEGGVLRESQRGESESEGGETKFHDILIMLQTFLIIWMKCCTNWLSKITP